MTSQLTTNTKNDAISTTYVLETLVTTLKVQPTTVLFFKKRIITYDQCIISQPMVKRSAKVNNNNNLNAE
jgi:hypothetical protein